MEFICSSLHAARHWRDCSPKFENSVIIYVKHKRQWTIYIYIYIYIYIKQINITQVGKGMTVNEWSYKWKKLHYLFKCLKSVMIKKKEELMHAVNKFIQLDLFQINAMLFNFLLIKWSWKNVSRFPILKY